MSGICSAHGVFQDIGDQCPRCAPPAAAQPRHHPDCVAAYCDGHCGREGPCYVDLSKRAAAAAQPPATPRCDGTIDHAAEIGETVLTDDTEDENA